MFQVLHKLLWDQIERKILEKKEIKFHQKKERYSIKTKGTVYRPVEYFPGYYVSRGGIIVNSKGVRLSHNWRGWPGQYLYVTFRRKGSKKRYKRQSHVIVAKAWVFNPDPERLKFVNKKSGNRSNIAAYNLEWTTHAENCKHRTGNKNKRRY